MGSYKEIEGDLIKLAQEGEFDVIAHGANCFCTMGAGIAVGMAKAFRADEFPKEQENFKGDYNKLGNIDFKAVRLAYSEGDAQRYRTTANVQYVLGFEELEKVVYVVNAYTQYNPGADARINALSLAMEKINYAFSGRTVGLPLIGCGIGGLKWSVVKSIFQQKLKDCDVIVVHYKP